MGSKIEKNKNELLLPRADDDRRCGLLETSAHAAGRGKAAEKANLLVCAPHARPLLVVAALFG